MDFLKRIQNLPEDKKKRIIWVFAIILGLIFLFVWIGIVKKTFSEFNKEELIENINFPDLKESQEVEKKLEELNYNLEENGE